ncbi:MAG: hypothetical protein JNL38_34685, partial [Myxococcales bacterium]|nr:hypothetical protein [Myxococcales bacterium]
RACAANDRAALDHFRATYRGEISGALSRLRADRDTVDEVTQIVGEKLFVGPTPKILEYRGRGTLRAFLRAVVVRAALSLRRRRTTEPPPGGDDDPLVDVAAPAADPATAHLVARYGPAYKRAVHEAIGELTPEDRNLLRLSLLEGVGIDALAGIYAVHRATVARWIARAQRAVAEGASRRLGEATQLAGPELESVARACRGELSLSLVRGLGRRD